MISPKSFDDKQRNISKHNPKIKFKNSPFLSPIPLTIADYDRLFVRGFLFDQQQKKNISPKGIRKSPGEIRFEKVSKTRSEIDSRGSMVIHRIVSRAGRPVGTNNTHTHTHIHRVSYQQRGAPCKSTFSLPSSLSPRLLRDNRSNGIPPLSAQSSPSYVYSSFHNRSWTRSSTILLSLSVINR